MTFLPFTNAANSDALRCTYDLIAEGYAEEHENDTWGYDLIDDVLATVPYEGTVLDIGCGPGRECAYMHKKGYQVTGVDISEGMLKQARLRTPSVSFLPMNIMRLEFKENSFNAIIARSVILHVSKKDVLQALGEISRVLVPGGAVYAAIKEGTGEEIVTETYYGRTYSRFFSYFVDDEFCALCACVGLYVKKIRHSRHMDKDRIQYIFEKI